MTFRRLESNGSSLEEDVYVSSVLCSVHLDSLTVLKCWVVILLLGPGAIRVRGRLAAGDSENLLPSPGARWKQLSQASSICFSPSRFQ